MSAELVEAWRWIANNDDGPANLLVPREHLKGMLDLLPDEPESVPVTATQVSLSIHLGETFGTSHRSGARRRFELRFGDHAVYRDSVWAGPDEMELATQEVASRLGDLLRDGALIQYEED